MSKAPTSVDLDAYRRSPGEADTASQREALIDQLGWLAEEAERLGPLLSALPAWAVEEAPLPEEQSVKEMLAALTARDRTTYSEWIRQLTTAKRPTLNDSAPVVPPDAQKAPLDALLADLQEARHGLVDAVRELDAPVWSQEVLLEDEPVMLASLVLRIVRHDADCLRGLAYRLHESNLVRS